MTPRNDPHAGHRPGSFMEAVSWLNRSAYGERLSCYSLREAVAHVVEREVYLHRETERLTTERDSWHAESEAWRKTAANLQERLDQFEAYAMPNVATALDRIAAAEARATEAEADVARLERLHAACDATIRALTSKALAAVRGQEAAEARAAEAERERDEANTLAAVRYRLAYGSVEVILRQKDFRETDQIIRLVGDPPPGATSILGLVEGLVSQRDAAKERALVSESALAAEKAAHEETKRGALCDICLGLPLTGTRPCACGGTGKISDAIVTVREHLVAAEDRAERLTGVDAAARGLFDALDYVTPGWRADTCVVHGDEVNRAWFELEKKLGQGPDAALAEEERR